MLRRWRKISLRLRSMMRGRTDSSRHRRNRGHVVLAIALAFREAGSKKAVRVVGDSSHHSHGLTNGTRIQVQQALKGYISSSTRRRRRHAAADPQTKDRIVMSISRRCSHLWSDVFASTTLRGQSQDIMKIKLLTLNIKQKLEQFYQHISCKRRVPHGYITLPNIDSIPACLPLLIQLAAVNHLIASSRPSSASNKTCDEQQMWVNFPALIDLIQQPLSHPCWNERP